MRKTVGCVMMAGMLLMAVVAFADKGLPVYNKGDAVYSCACGEGCECKTMSRKEGKCACGNKLGKGTVSSVEGDKAVVTVAGKDLSFSTKAKYICGCGDACTCGTISQKPGTCGCGKPLKKVE
ncbi:hypothetical protein [Pelotalea chapellei]|uniref:Uncharacterized protein n=1 Tax=Pelotalea chapellei TaxID=44671 RepID=A0ABS5U679_9BACT|nr:hypothetical protein [Pelotalea chapellei]MBT1071173.1 hypothetical protein [Pelotalea chapellei]